VLELLDVERDSAAVPALAAPLRTRCFMDQEVRLRHVLVAVGTLHRPHRALSIFVRAHDGRRELGAAEGACDEPPLALRREVRLHVHRCDCRLAKLAA
jgi:hypothetical protein